MSKNDNKHFAFGSILSPSSSADVSQIQLEHFRGIDGLANHKSLNELKPLNVQTSFNFDELEDKASSHEKQRSVTGAAHG